MSQNYMISLTILGAFGYIYMYTHLYFFKFLIDYFDRGRVRSGDIPLPSKRKSTELS